MHTYSTHKEVHEKPGKWLLPGNQERVAEQMFGVQSPMLSEAGH